MTTAVLHPSGVRATFPRVSPIAGLLLAALAVHGGAYLAAVALLDAPPFLLIATAVCAVLGAIVLTGRRWAAIPAGVLVALNFVIELGPIVAWHLHDTEHAGAFAISVVVSPIAGALAVVAAVLYTVRAYRGPTMDLPRWARTGAVVAVAAAVGGSAVAFVPQYGVPARVSDAAVDSLTPSVVMASNAFVQEEIRVSQGDLVQWRVANADNQAHSFDLDAYGIHLTVGGGESGFVMFIADKPGTFEFNCNVPGHTMSGQFIVE